MHTHDLTGDGPVLVKRYTSWGRGEHRSEWAALQLIHEHLPGLVPEPLHGDLDADPPSITMTRLPGEPLGPSPTGPVLDALAVAIARLWTVPLPPPSAAAWADDLPFARRLIAGDRPAEGVTAEAYDAAIGWWDGPDPELLGTPPEDLVLGHRDPNLDNYLWDGRRVRIVDFEDAGPSDPANELAILVEHLSARSVPPDAILSRFTGIDQRRLQAGRRLWAMFWLRLLLPGGPGARRNPPGTADRQAVRLLTLLR